jgi:cytochrome c553
MENIHREDRANMKAEVERILKELRYDFRPSRDGFLVYRMKEGIDEDDFSQLPATYQRLSKNFIWLTVY